MFFKQGVNAEFVRSICLWVPARTTGNGLRKIDFNCPPANAGCKRVCIN